MSDETHGVLADLVETVEMMQAQIADLRGRLSRISGGVRMPSVGGIQSALPYDDLDEWVEWLVTTYELEGVVPTCWREHPAMVEEIGALRAAHAGATDEVDSRPSDRLVWQESLPRSLQRLREWDRTRCRTRGHVPVD